MNPKVNWNEENETKLITLWKDPDMTAADISAEIPGSTRNGVLGKAHRMGLESKKRSLNNKPRHRRKPTIQMLKIRQLVPMDPITKPTGDPDTWIPFLDAGNTTCRAIMGDGFDEHSLVRFCPNKKSIEQSYCPYHIGLYYNPPRPR